MSSMRSASMPSISERVLVFGTFDHLHPGHLFFLGQALERGTLTIVVARDSTVLKMKGKRPHQPEEVRHHALQEAIPSASVLLGHPSDFLAPVRKVRPSLILLGHDQTLPPGVTRTALPCRVERIEAFLPGAFKSSILRYREAPSGGARNVLE